MQSSALPLGHAAVGLKDIITPLDRISQKKKKVLVLSNGHGEDLIALRVIEALHHLNHELKLEVLPLVGEGKTFSKAIANQWLVKKGISKRLPSGGFSNQSLRGFLADITAGLICVTWKNWLVVRNAAKNGSFILAIGDLLPLFFAWSSGGLYAFLGTPKSDYTWVSAQRQSFSDYYHRFKGTEWDPWECYLMQDVRCKVVAVRDQLTARSLRMKRIRAMACGNPMMDGLGHMQCPLSLKSFRRLILLCGSRMPEAMRNFKRLLLAIEQIERNTPFLILVAIGAEPSLIELCDYLSRVGYRKEPSFEQGLSSDACFEKKGLKIVIGVGKFVEWSRFAEVGIANAGTATEQLVGLGVPCVSLPGDGPQFKYAFATRQSRLLGGAVIPCKSPKQMAQIIPVLLRQSKFRDSLSLVGKKRMGPAGGSKALAKLILNSFVVNIQ